MTTVHQVIYAIYGCLQCRAAEVINISKQEQVDTKHLHLFSKLSKYYYDSQNTKLTNFDDVKRKSIQSLVISRYSEN